MVTAILAPRCNLVTPVLDVALGTPYPGGRTLRSCLEGQPNILLRQRRLGMLRGLQIVELVQPHALFERRFGGKAMQEHREPPGHTYGAPHATQRHLRIAIEVMSSTRAVSLDQRSGQIKHVRDRKVKALCPSRGDDVGG